MTEPISIDALRTALAQSPDDALKIEREAALQALASAGLPTTRHEDWKYTDLSKVYALNEAWLANGDQWPAGPATTVDVAAHSRGFDADWLVLSNGVPSEASLCAFQQDGIRIERLAQTGTQTALDAPLAHLNLAQLTDGLRIVVEKHGDRRPLGLLFLDDIEHAVTSSRIEIHVAAGCTLDVFELHTPGSSSVANGVVSVSTAENSRVNYVRLQDRAQSQSLTTGLYVSPSTASEFNYAGFDLGGGFVRHDIVAEITEADARVSIAGLYVADAEQHIDNHSRVDHRVGPAESTQSFKGILAGKSRAVWNGKAVVHVGADGTNAEQSNHNILLSRHAEVDTKPELEIYADDVRCSHGTTVGALDERALFYLQSRGLDRQAARALLVRAFAQQIVQTTPIKRLEEAISERVAQRVEAMIDGPTDD